MRHLLSGLVFALTTVPLLACGHSSPSGPSRQASPAQVVALSADAPLDEAAQERLASRSPDALIDDAPPEPGMSALGFHPPKEDLGNFGTVTPMLWRGARPTVKGLMQLKTRGVKTIVNLENDRQVVEFERQWCEANGVGFESLPMSVITPPRMARIDQWLSIARDPARQPVYVHCLQGRDRTGTAIYTYRVKVQGWTHDRAYPEMVAYKFHTYLLGLRAFVWWFGRTQGPDIRIEPVPAA